MWTRQHRPRKTGRLIIPALAAVVLSYFGFHVYHGAFGIDSKDQLQMRAAVLEVKLDEVRSVRIALEGKVRMLRDGTIDKDTLDEQARRALNLSHADEVTIMLPSAGRIN